MFRIAPILLLALSLMPNSFASDDGFKYPEKPSGRINDYANVIPQGAKVTLSAKSEALERRTGIQAVVAVFPSLYDETIDKVANELFSKWVLGSKERNDGLLLVISVKERKMRIEVGYGLEAQLTDMQSGRLLHQKMRPLLDDNDVAGAVAKFYEATDKLSAVDPTKIPTMTIVYAKIKSSVALVIVLIVLLLIVLDVLYLVFRNSTSSSNDDSTLVLLSILRLIMNIAFLILSGGKSGGGFGGGGGSSGGGGASD